MRLFIMSFKQATLAACGFTKRLRTHDDPVPGSRPAQDVVVVSACQNPAQASWVRSVAVQLPAGSRQRRQPITQAALPKGSSGSSIISPRCTVQSGAGWVLWQGCGGDGGGWVLVVVVLVGGGAGGC